MSYHANYIRIGGVPLPELMFASTRSHISLLEKLAVATSVPLETIFQSEFIFDLVVTLSSVTTPDHSTPGRVLTKEWKTGIIATNHGAGIKVDGSFGDRLQGSMC
jgi:hypothetical protein